MCTHTRTHTHTHTHTPQEVQTAEFKLAEAREGLHDTQRLRQSLADDIESLQAARDAALGAKQAAESDLLRYQQELGGAHSEARGRGQVAALPAYVSVLCP